MLRKAPFILLAAVFLLILPRTVSAVTAPDGLGHCHWYGGPTQNNPNVKWGYSASIPFAFGDGVGDGWAAIEPVKGQYNFKQIRGEVESAKKWGKKIWVQVHFANNSNKEHNVPKWALDEGVQVYQDSCGDPNIKRYWQEYKWTDVAPGWDNPKYGDKNEAVRFTDGGVDKVKYPLKIGAVWDPKLIDYYTKVLRALKTEFQADIDSGVITGINLMSGGIFGESAFNPKCPAWGTDCTPDVLNPACPIIQSMAQAKGKTAEQIAQKSMCNSEPGEEVKACTQEPCPREYNSYCYVFDDYFIQAVKTLVSKQAEIFPDLPIIWQEGSGLSGTGRTNKDLTDWMNRNYGNRIYFKFNGWGPSDKFFNTRNFNRYGTSTRHGYECGSPWSFSRSFFVGNDGYKTFCSQQTEKPTACVDATLDKEEVGRLAIVQAIKRGIVEDRSSYLCMQSSFFDNAPVDRGGGKLGNEYYFNPNDNTENCDNSEINVAKYGYGFCPGYLNYVFSHADVTNNTPPLPTGIPGDTPQPTQPGDTPVPTATNGQNYSCQSCPSGPAKTAGNGNCDGTVNNDDFLVWENTFIKYISGNATQVELGASDFDCFGSQTSNTIDLIDFEIWRKSRYGAAATSGALPAATPAPSDTPAPTATPAPNATSTPTPTQAAAAAEAGKIKGTITLNASPPGDEVYANMYNYDGGGYVNHVKAVKTAAGKYSYVLDKDSSGNALNKDKYRMSAVTYIKDNANGGLFEHIDVPESCKEREWSYECIASGVLSPGFIQDFTINVPQGNSQISGSVTVTGRNNQELKYLLVYLCDTAASDHCLTKYFFVKRSYESMMAQQRPDGGNYIFPFVDAGKTYYLYAYANFPTGGTYFVNPASDCANPVTAGNYRICPVAAGGTQNFHLNLSP